MVVAVAGTALAGVAVAGNLQASDAPVHPAIPAVPCSSYSIYGDIYEVTNLGVRTLVNGANFWVNWTFTNQSGGANSWFGHTWNGGQYQLDLPLGSLAGCGSGDTITLYANLNDQANVTVSNSTTITLPGPGSQMNGLLKAPALATTLTANPLQGESTLPVAFTTTHTGGTGGYSFTFMFNDGSKAVTGNGTWTSHTYVAVRWYNATVFLNDSFGDSLQSNIQVIKVVPAPSIVSFTVWPQVLNNSHAANFATTIVNGGSPYSYDYTLGIALATVTHAGSGSTTDSLTYWYKGEITNQWATTGTTANVTVTDHDGKVAGPSSVTLWIYNVSAHAASDGVTSLAHADVGQVVSFTGTATGGSGTYATSWRFDDGGSASGLTANHAFAAVGTYTVNFTVNDTGHAGNSVSTTYVIIVNPALTAALVSNRSAVDAGHYVSFNASASGGTAPYGYYNISFGDGSPNQNGAATYASHQYTVAGSYGARDCSDDSVGVIACSYPTVGITVNGGLAVSGTMENKTTSVATTIGYVGETMSFVSSGSGGTAPYTYGFLFGDGGTQAFSASPTATHAYAAAGPYTVTYQIKDAGLGYATSTEAITIYAPLVMNPLTANRTAGELDLSVAFTASWTGGAGWVHTNWTFGDGATQGPTNWATSPATALHTYTAVANVTAIVVAADSQGERFVQFLKIFVYPQLAITITPTLGNLAPPLNASFTAWIHGGSYNYPTTSWNLGNGNVSVAPNILVQTYWHSGTYRVTLLVTDNASDNDGAATSFTVSGSNTTDTLKAGWQLVSLPGTTTNYDLWFVWEDLVLAGEAPATSEVVIQDTTGGSLNYTFEGGLAGSAAVANQAIGAARGMWIDVATSKNVGFSATSTAGPLGSATTLQAGWNNLGWVLSGATTASGIATLIPSATQMSVFNAATQSYTTYVVGFSGPAYNFAVVNGDGFLVYVPAATSFTE